MGVGVGVVDLDARIAAKWYYSDFIVKELSYVGLCNQYWEIEVTEMSIMI